MEERRCERSPARDDGQLRLFIGGVNTPWINRGDAFEECARAILHLKRMKPGGGLGLSTTFDFAELSGGASIWATTKTEGRIHCAPYQTPLEPRSDSLLVKMILHLPRKHRAQLRIWVTRVETDNVGRSRSAGQVFLP